MNSNLQENEWSENVILVDADYIDSVALHMITHFGRLLGRQIPAADLAQWLDCIALDGGMRPSASEEGASVPEKKSHKTQVMLIHPKGKTRMEHFQPADLDYLNGKAFSDQLGEFTINTYPIENIAGGENLLTDILELVAVRKEVKRIMVVPHAENPYIYNKVREVLSHLDDEGKSITVFTMNPNANGNFKQEILGFSLLSALGIRSDEIPEKTNEGTSKTIN